MGSRRSGSGSKALSAAVTALVLGLTALAWSAAALAGSGGSGAATITGSFSDGCRDFAARSSKDISHVVLHYADGSVVKDETTVRPDYAIDGAAGDELDSASVKSGTTTETFTCPRTNTPPTAILEIRTPPLSECAPINNLEYPTCDAEASRTAWSSLPDGVIGFYFRDGRYPLSFSFQGTGSTDPDSDITSWSIDFGDGTSTSGNWTAEPPTEIAHVYLDFNLLPTVTLTVTDSAGQSDSDTIKVEWFDVTPD